jgi:hypothetical protein
MAIPTAYVRFGDVTIVFLTEGRDLHTALKQGGQRAGNTGVHLQKFAGIRLQDGWNRTCLTKISRPGLAGGFEQAAFLTLPATEIISVKIFTLFSSRGSHSMAFKEKASVLIPTSHSPIIASGTGT